MNKRVLVVAPHPDDETLGTGGTIAKWSSQGHHLFVLVVAGHLPPLYTREQYETTTAEAKAAFAVLGVSRSRFLEIPATTLGGRPPTDLHKQLTGVIAELRPHTVLCPFPDRHVDHRVIFESVMVAARPVGAGRCIEMLAAYETLSETHWNAPHIEPNFVPTWTVDITGHIDQKLKALNCYQSQIPPFPGPRSLEAARALAQFRGTQAGFAFGEAFHVIRLVC